MTNTLLVGAVPNFKDMFIFPQSASERIHKIRIHMSSEEMTDEIKYELGQAVAQFRPDRVVLIHDVHAKDSHDLVDILNDVIHTFPDRISFEQIEI